MSRVVTVSSETHSWDGPLDFADLMADKRDIEGSPFFNPLYYRSKLANALFSLELSKKLQGSGVTTYAMTPGIVFTDLRRNWKFPWTLFFIVMTPVQKLLLKSIEDVSQDFYAFHDL